MIVTIISLIYINYKLRPLILDIAETKITQYINKAMSIVVHHTIYQDLSSDELLERFEKQDLPKTREEFEIRADLFQLLNEIDHYLTIKNQTVKDNVDPLSRTFKKRLS